MIAPRSLSWLAAPSLALFLIGCGGAGGSGETGTRAVTPEKPAITWGTPAAITYGTALGGAQLNAAANVPGTFTYTPAAGTVLGAGNQTLSVTFTPMDTTDYAAASDEVTLTVTQATPTITWAMPGAITYGTALSGAQLDASANIPGTFAYSPPLGDMLMVGTQTLSVTFTPNDTVDYTEAVANVSLSVIATGPYVTITWNADADAIFPILGYNIYRSQQANGPFTTLLNPSPVSTTMYSDLDVLTGQTYYYVVTLVDVIGEESLDSDVVSAIP